MADYRRSLQELKEEWSSCTKCELGQRRKEVEGEFVFGEGVGGRGIMFIGEGPGSLRRRTEDPSSDPRAKC